jgi:DNA-directed RNA polymerase specialized sigma subunit
LTEMIDQKVFSERDRKILKRKFVDGLTFEEVAEEYYLSTQRIKAIVAFHKKRLFKD